MKKLTVIIDRVIGTVRSAIYDPVNKYSAEVDSGRALKVAGTVSGTIPLPTGAATEATLSALNAKVTACNTGAVTVAASALPTGAATETTLSTLNGKVTACNTGAIAGTVTANAGTNLNTSALALETGGNLAAAATSLSSIDGKITACNTGAIAGTVTANAGTNLNTSALALETGGNLAAAATSVSSIDGKITACNTGAVVVSSGTITSITNPVAVTGTFWQATQPVSGTVGVSNFPTEYPLPAAQVVTLTPPAAITGFNLETTQEDVLENLQALNSLAPSVYDTIDLTYTSGNLTGVVFKLAAATVSTLTLTYDGSNNLTKVEKS